MLCDLHIIAIIVGILSSHIELDEFATTFQIELDEFETTSLLVANLVWDESVSHTFEKAVRCLELTLRQVLDL